MKLDKSISQKQPRDQVFNSLLSQFIEFFSHDPKALSHYLYFEQGLSLTEIGKIVGLHRTAVKYKYFKGIKIRNQKGEIK